MWPVEVLVGGRQAGHHRGADPGRPVCIAAQAGCCHGGWTSVHRMERLQLVIAPGVAWSLPALNVTLAVYKPH